MQTPMGSGFTAMSTTDDVLDGVDLNGKTAIVTGGYSGLGKQTVRAFRAAGAEIVVPARDVARAAGELSDIGGVVVDELDLLDPTSIDAFAERFLASGRPLHILVNSAGVMANPLTRDARGYESQFATNHLGHFQLTTRLLPALRRAGGARVVSVSSRGHRYSDVHFDDPNFEHREYAPYEAYGQSKTANVLFAVELDERERANRIRAFAVHPGSIITHLTRYSNRETLRQGGFLDENYEPIIDPERGLKTVEQGAATQVWCAASPQLEGYGGVYCEDVDIAAVHVADVPDTDVLAVTPGAFGVLPYAIDRDSARRLWKLSEELLDLG
ncbi:SDR family NAD(P)-dependent oxidoreductase [Kribbella sindirgiensis]|uniref:Probable oxidoreductase n=1 Tax=Kribbella sindirgiensis TaxID=1124744 RepID=A0A4R0IJW9_9ACTN|nr:SDR family NAD(P)-dependent oxidoreductase [Kribbella sindirgiensis]TCC32530.1 SDR family NAD(P)-dependent oxidoreductase [Kribbella sindirgiensis]